MAQNGAKSKSNVVKIDQTELWRMGSNWSGFVASLVSIAIACAYAAARTAAFAKNDLWEHYHMIRQRKRPNAKEAKTLKVLSEFKRSGLSSWKTSGNHFIQALDDAMAIVENEMSRCTVIQHASRKYRRFWSLNLRKAADIVAEATLACISAVPRKPTWTPLGTPPRQRA